MIQMSNVTHDYHLMIKMIFVNKDYHPVILMIILNSNDVDHPVKMQMIIVTADNHPKLQAKVLAKCCFWKMLPIAESNLTKVRGKSKAWRKSDFTLK